MAEFILEDGKLVTDGIPSERIPSDMNSSLQVATDVNCKMQSSPKTSSKFFPNLSKPFFIRLLFPADKAKSVLFKVLVLRRLNINVTGVNPERGGRVT